ncbi:MAG: SpoIIE family protein phosphatase [Desulfobacteraceae bacterium]|nr:SpoIIE family protein phosphatase [Desulfobacteraceae bacterium]
MEEHVNKPAETRWIKAELNAAMKIVEKSPVILFRRLPGEDARLVYVSENVMRFGYTADEFTTLKVSFEDLVHPDDHDRMGQEINDFAEKGVTDYTQYYRITARNGNVHWVEDTTTTETDADGNILFYQGTVVDITERVLAEEKLKKTEARFRRIVETAAEGFVMIDVNARIMDVNEAFCRMLGYSRKELLERDPLDLADSEFRAFLKINGPALLKQTHSSFEGSLKARNGRRVPVLLHCNSLLADSGEMLGYVGFVADLTRHKKSLLLAGEVQKNLLPKGPPAISGLDIAGKSVPCEEVGGDFFDYLQPRTPDGPDPSVLTVAIGDIAGHGIDSALLMATARAVFRDQYTVTGNLPTIVAEMNRVLQSDFNPTSGFMTLFALQIDQNLCALRWVRAGHDPALVYNSMADSFSELGGPGVALGVLDDTEFIEGSVKGIAPGSVISLGTDGIWEAFNPSGMRFGKDRFRSLIRKYASESAADILKHVYREVHEFAQGAKQQDDITLVIIKVLDAISCG